MKPAYLLAVLLLALGAGCTRKPAPFAPVVGKVQYRGAIVNSGLVVFTPDPTRGESGPSAVGHIRTDGTYTLYTGEAPGTSAGFYRVAIAALAPGVLGASTHPILPERYRDPQLSQIACEVKSDRTNQLDFNLD